MTIKEKFNSLNVGDTVKIVKAFRENTKLVFRPEMKEQIGLTGVITDKDSYDHSIEIDIEGCSNRWYWLMSSIEKVKETKPLSKEEIYLQLQNKWVELNDVKRGTKVRLFRSWEDGEGGYSTNNHSFYGDDLGESIVEDISTEDGPCIICDGFDAPYFCLEVVEDQNEWVVIYSSDFTIRHDNFIITINSEGEIWNNTKNEIIYNAKEAEEFIKAMRILKNANLLDKFEFLLNFNKCVLGNEVDSIIEAYDKVVNP